MALTGSNSEHGRQPVNHSAELSVLPYLTEPTSLAFAVYFSVRGYILLKLFYVKVIKKVTNSPAN